jgi:3-oxoacyl-[acyl-carrier-protein] synthase III
VVKIHQERSISGFMATSVVIKDVATYHPEKVVNNEFYQKHFEKQGKDITNLLDAFGRKNRYVADYERETTLTMAIEATKRVMEKSKVKAEDLDMIVFVSGTPEYLFPTNAAYIHHAIQGKFETIVYDMNVACVGMVVAVEQVSRYMLSNPHIQRALVVGAEQMLRYARKEDPVTYASFGDGASAVILEKQEKEGEKTGFIDSHYYTNTDSCHKIVLPACGLSNLYNPEISDYDKRFKWENVNEDKGFILTASSIQNVLERHHLTPDDIKVFCLSQLSKKNIGRVAEALGQDLSKFIFVGDEFGYTGSCSPFIALNRAIEEGKLKRGDYIMFWSIGAGYTACSMLFRY